MENVIPIRIKVVSTIEIIIGYYSFCSFKSFKAIRIITLTVPLNY